MQGGGHSGNAAADDQDILVDGETVIFEWMGLGHRAHSHAHQILGFLRGLFRQMGMDPGRLIANIGNLDQVFVQSGLADGFLKLGLMGPGRTAADDHPVQSVVNDALLNLLDGLAAAAMSFGLGDNNIGQGFRIVDNLGDIDDTADIITTIADKDSDSRGLVRSHRVRQAVSDAGSFFATCKILAGHAGRGTGLHHGLGNILRDSQPCRRHRYPAWKSPPD